MIQLDRNIPNCRNLSLQEQRKERMNKLNTEEKQSPEGSLKYVIPYTYSQEKLMRLGNAMSCKTWTGISCKHLLAAPL
jgi:hypothetical protein